MCLKKLTPSKAPLVTLEELRSFYIPSKDGHINFDDPGKILGGVIFDLLNRYLQKHSIPVVKIRHPRFREAYWNDCSDTVLLVKRTEALIPVELKTRNGCAVLGYDVIDQRMLKEYQEGFLKITSNNAVA
jgi:hypothetical protein